MPPVEVDWEAIGNPIPVAQTPAEKELRDELFKQMDVNKNGWLTLTEVLAGLPKLLEDSDDRRTGEKSKCKVALDDVKPAAKAAYKMAQHVAAPKAEGRRARRAADCIDRKEFHALLMAFTIHVELDVLFEKMDKGEDRRLHWKEVEKFIDKLEPWNITKQVARRKFKDDWTPSMEYKDFAEWCILRKFHGGPPLQLDENDPEASLKDEVGGANLGAILDAFKEWDTDGTNNISKEELSTILLAIDDTFTQEMADELFAASDVNNDGVIDYVEFSDWLTKDAAETS